MLDQGKVSEWSLVTDILVLGSSPGGLVCSLVAHDNGSDVVLIEKGEKFGGGSAYSAGEVWIPNNYHQKEIGIPDSREEAIQYLKSISGGRYSEEILEAYVDNAPKMLEYLEKTTPLRLLIIRGLADYYAEREGIHGGKVEGRYLAPPLIWARHELGDLADSVRRSPHFPIPVAWKELDEWGGMANMPNFDYNLLAERYEDDVRGFGAALIAWLVKACTDRGIRMQLWTRAKELIVSSNRSVVGVRVEREGQSLNFRARQAVVVATGGFEWNERLRKLYLHSPPLFPYTVPTNEGDGLVMSQDVGAATALMDLSLLIPVMRIPGEEHCGKPLYRQVNHEICLPHTIIVNKQGCRFANETFYVDVANNGMCLIDAKNLTYPNLPAYMIFDQNYKDKYFLGTVAPDEYPDWLIRTKTIRGLASLIGIDSKKLEKTVERFNEFARKGIDLDFHRGDMPYDMINGDPANKPNSTLGIIERPDFFAVELFVGTAGTRGGVIINKNAQVLHVCGREIPRLYACSNVVAHLAVGQGYNSGLSIGQSMVFGYVSALHATKQTKIVV